MHENYRYTVSLRIWHPTVHPDRFTEALGLTPDGIDIAGQSRVRKGRVMPPIVPKTSYWYCDLGHDPERNVADFLHERAQALTVHSAFFRALSEEGGKAEFFVGFFAEEFNCGFDLSPVLHRLCADLSLWLAFDVYGYRDNDDNDDAEAEAKAGSETDVSAAPRSNESSA
ncbi:MAG: hypothetical protein KA144_15950 [Xanthomonadaceae bacterium]|nr:hypothetical protein [Xanthomonadaceae bacterium]